MAYDKFIKLRFYENNKSTTRYEPSKGENMKKTHRPTKNEITPERFDLLCDMEAVSATEQTGLIAFAPKNDYEYNNYNEIIDFQENYKK